MKQIFLDFQESCLCYERWSFNTNDSISQPQ